MILRKLKNNIAIRAFIKLVDDEGLEYAGYLSYLNIFSLFPLFIILISAIGALNQTKEGLQIINLILSQIPEHTLSLIKPQIDGIMHSPPISILSFVFIGAIWTTTSSMEGMRTIFNKVYKVKNPPFFMITRILSIAQFTIIVLALISTLFFLVLLPKVLVYISQITNTHISYLENKYTEYPIIVGVLVAIVASMYYSLTNKKVSVAEVLPGSVFTVFAWFLASKLMSYYISLNMSNFNFVYGGVSGILIVMIFFYIINLILLYGAEINCLLEKKNR